MHAFVRNLITEWRRLELPFTGATVIAAVSGGADSVSLLLGLDELKNAGKIQLRIIAAHLNHKLRGRESDEDAEFVRSLTTKLKMELVLESANIPRNTNTEQAARKFRYEFLYRTACKLNAYAVVTGHTINDQAETFLLNLLRGSGPDGLSAMSRVRKLDPPAAECGNNGAEQYLFSSAPLLVRPMLRWAKRRQTEGYCHDRGVEFRYDTMNEDSAYKRVRIRKVLLPLLEDFNPKIVETLANTADLIRLSNEGRRLPGPECAPTLNLKILKSRSKSELYDELRSWIEHNRGNLRSIGLKHIESVERLIFSRKSGREVELPGGDRIIKTNGELVFKRFMVEK